MTATLPHSTHVGAVALQVEDGAVEMASLPIDARGLQTTASGAPWTGLPPGSCIGHVHLHVGDLGQSMAFYGDVIGLAVTNASYPGAVFLAAGGYHHHLGTNTWAGRGAVAASEGDARLLWWELVLPAAQAVAAVAARAERVVPPQPRFANGPLLLHDPWGSCVRVVARHG
jgi:catechol 2,3-dioxygenase